jgi:hypothetical protein
MRSFIVAAVLCVAATASGQNIYTPGYYGGVGPWQPTDTAPTSKKKVSTSFGRFVENSNTVALAAAGNNPAHFSGILDIRTIQCRLAATPDRTTDPVGLSSRTSCARGQSVSQRGRLYAWLG